MTIERLGVVGAGAFGTALAQLASAGGRETMLWGRDSAVIQSINDQRENRAYLPGVQLHASLAATNRLDDLADCDCWLLVTPAQAMREVLSAAPRGSRSLILCSKGVEASTGKFMSDVAEEIAPGNVLGVLTGPGFAEEIAAGLPTAVTFASAERNLYDAFRERLSAPSFRLYHTNDLIGAQVGGSVKNVLAIASGVVEGRALGQSARAALIARGFAEMSRFALACGARRETLAGLCGLGDLVLTCSSPSSRNFSLGLGLGQGRSAAELMEGSHSVVEGAFSAPVITRLARDRGVDMPIVAAVEGVLAGRFTVDEVLDALLSRPPRSEAH
jgi:glycerol-3-phosphate dehydrogenase (NAD(P)+)